MSRSLDRLLVGHLRSFQSTGSTPTGIAVRNGRNGTKVHSLTVREARPVPTDPRDQLVAELEAQREARRRHG